MDNTSHGAVLVRKGTPADGELLCHLISSLADYEKLPRPTAEAEQRLMHDAYGPHPRFETWFGVYDGAAVGYAISF